MVKEALDQYEMDSVYDDVDDQDDWMPQADSSLAAIPKALFDTTVGKLRKAVLTPRKAVAVARAHAYASMFNIPELAALTDMLSDTTVSINGKGLDQMVRVMAARMEADSESNGLGRITRNLGVR
jgi:hypothetical protein